MRFARTRENLFGLLLICIGAGVIALVLKGALWIERTLGVPHWCLFYVVPVGLLFALGPLTDVYKDLRDWRSNKEREE